MDELLADLVWWMELLLEDFDWWIDELLTDLERSNLADFRFKVPTFPDFSISAELALRYIRPLSLLVCVSVRPVLVCIGVLYRKESSCKPVFSTGEPVLPGTGFWVVSLGGEDRIYRLLDWTRDLFWINRGFISERSESESLIKNDKIENYKIE